MAHRRAETIAISISIAVTYAGAYAATALRFGVRTVAVWITRRLDAPRRVNGGNS